MVKYCNTEKKNKKTQKQQNAAQKIVIYIYLNIDFTHIKHRQRKNTKQKKNVKFNNTEKDLQYYQS